MVFFLHDNSLELVKIERLKEVHNDHIWTRIRPYIVVLLTSELIVQETSEKDVKKTHVLDPPGTKI